MKQRELVNQLSQKILSEISDILVNESSNNMEVSKKDDSSVVTNVDTRLSALIKAEVQRNFGDEYNFYCEEDHHELSFPAVVLDPIDGTKGLVTGTYECAVSMAIMETSELKNNYGYIFNPFTGFKISSDDPFLLLSKKSLSSKLGFVSRSEWEKDVYKNFQNDDISLSPVGSIAYKLGLLAAGACDFVFSANSKNIWDIAAGSILCQQRGILLYDKEGKELQELREQHIKGPMFWCRPEMRDQIVTMVELRRKSK